MNFLHQKTNPKRKIEIQQSLEKPKIIKRKPVPPEEAPEFYKIKFMKHCCLQKGKPKYSLIVGLGFIMGLRRNEMRQVKVKHFKIHERKLVLPQNICKKGSGGTVPIIEIDFAEEVREHIDQSSLNEDDFVLNHGKERKPFSNRRINYIIAEIGNWAGFKHMRPHLLRHARAKWLVRNGYSDIHIQKFLRHKDPATTVRMYNRFRDDEVMQMLHEGKKSTW